LKESLHCFKISMVKGEQRRGQCSVKWAAKRVAKIREGWKSEMGVTRLVKSGTDD